MTNPHLWEKYKPNADYADNCLICMNCSVTAHTDDNKNIIIDGNFVGEVFSSCGDESKLAVLAATPT